MYIILGNGSVKKYEPKYESTINKNCPGIFCSKIAGIISIALRKANNYASTF
jgi:hypothetical protein